MVRRCESHVKPWYGICSQEPERDLYWVRILLDNAICESNDGILQLCYLRRTCKVNCRVEKPVLKVKMRDFNGG